MSSYLSSVYVLAEQRLMRIRSQCQAEYRQACENASKNQQELERYLYQRQAREIEKQQQEERLEQEIEHSLLQQEESRNQMKQEVQQLMKLAQERLIEAEKAFGMDESLRDQFEMFKSSAELFGVNQALLGQLRVFVQQNLEENVEQARESAEAERISKCMDEDGFNRMLSEDRSVEFVSMAPEKTEKLVHTVSKWDGFMARLEAVAASSAVGDQAQTLLEQSCGIEERRRNAWMLRNEKALKAMENESRFELAEQKEMREKQDRLYSEYLAVYMLSGATEPMLERNVQTAWLESECRRLRGLYEEKRIQEYMNHAFSEVLGGYGIAFQGAEYDGNGLVTMEYSMDDVAGLQITRFASGGFEMQFGGHFQGNEASLDEERHVQEKAFSFCQLLPQIAADLEARGISFSNVMVKQPQEQEVVSLGRRCSVQQYGRQRKYMTMD